MVKRSTLFTVTILAALMSVGWYGYSEMAQSSPPSHLIELELPDGLVQPFRVKGSVNARDLGGGITGYFFENADTGHIVALYCCPGMKVRVSPPVAIGR